jgi:RNA polymerase sigma-70 factor (ECF subfamily)
VVGQLDFAWAVPDGPALSKAGGILVSAPAIAPGTVNALLVAVATLGDRFAFECLFRQFAPRIKTYLLRCGVPHAVADELVQEAMLTVWRKAALFDPSKASAATWIFTIARNLHIDVIRRSRRPTFDPLDPAFVRDAEPAADSELIRAQSEAQIREIVKALPAAQREILQLSFFAEQPHSVIAKQLDLPIGTVKSRVRLALRRIRGRLQP